jgi:hypothetical protein
MKHAIVVCKICAVLLFAAAVYVFAPTLKSRVEAKWLLHSEPPAHQAEAAPIYAKPKPTPSASQAVMHTAPKGAVGPPDPGSLRWQDIHRNLSQPDPIPEAHSKTVSFMPGQATNIPNRKFRKVEVRSEYPLRVLTGRCHSDYTVEFFCSGDPADIFIADTRHKPIIMAPRANSVTITVTEF